MWLCLNICKLSEESLNYMGFEKWKWARLSLQGYLIRWRVLLAWGQGQADDITPCTLALASLTHFLQTRLSCSSPPEKIPHFEMFWKPAEGSCSPSRICLFSSSIEAVDDRRQSWHQLNWSNGTNNIGCWRNWYCVTFKCEQTDFL